MTSKKPGNSSRSGGSSRSRWESRLQELLDFRSIHGHVQVPRYWPLHPKLANWVHNQRRFLRLGQLSKEQVERLEQEGIGWQSLSVFRKTQQGIWDRFFGALREFRQRTGHLRVPRGWEAEPTLSAWLANQRHQLMKGTLSPSRLERLNELDADWQHSRVRPLREDRRPKTTNQRDAAWERRCSALRRYRDRSGHCNVPARWPGNPPLARWVVLQRYLYRSGRLDAERIARLESLVFVWSGREVRESRGDLRWERRFAELMRYRRRAGHCAVEMSGSRGRGLARWVSAQRTAYKAGRIKASRKQRLDAAGFVWKVRRRKRR